MNMELTLNESLLVAESQLEEHLPLCSRQAQECFKLYMRINGSNPAIRNSNRRNIYLGVWLNIYVM